MGAFLNQRTSIGISWAFRTSILLMTCLPLLILSDNMRKWASCIRTITDIPTIFTGIHLFLQISDDHVSSIIIQMIGVIIIWQSFTSRHTFSIWAEKSFRIINFYWWKVFQDFIIHWIIWFDTIYIVLIHRTFFSQIRSNSEWTDIKTIFDIKVQIRLIFYENNPFFTSG